MAKLTQFVLFCLALFAISVAARCPVGKKLSFEQAACFQAGEGSQNVALSTLFSNIGRQEGENVEVKKYECSDLSRRKCEQIDEVVNFYEGEEQHIKIDLAGCSGEKYSSSPKCCVFYDVHLKCDTKHQPKASILIPSTEAAIFNEAAGCNYFPQEDSEDSCPEMTISFEYNEDVADETGVEQGLIKVHGSKSDQQKLQNAYLRYYVEIEGSGSCDSETSYLQLPVTSVHANFADLVGDCFEGGDNLVAELVYTCKEHTFTSAKVKLSLEKISRRR